VAYFFGGHPVGYYLLANGTMRYLDLVEPKCGWILFRWQVPRI